MKVLFSIAGPSEPGILLWTHGQKNSLKSLKSRHALKSVQREKKGQAQSCHWAFPKLVLHMGNVKL